LSSVSNVQEVVEARNGSMALALAMILPFIALLAGVSIWYGYQTTYACLLYRIQLLNLKDIITSLLCLMQVFSFSFQYYEEPATFACDRNWL